MARTPGSGFVTEAMLEDALSGNPTGGTPLPDGAETGQVLSWDGDSAAWVNPPVALPTGGAAGQVLTKTSTGHAWQTPSTSATWDADTLAIARGFHEVLSNTEPTQPFYTASNGQVYPVVWIKPIIKGVPVIPEEPFWYRDSSSIEVPDLIGIEYRITAITKDATTTSVDYVIAPGSLFDVTTEITEASLPYAVKVEAFPTPGYELPGPYVWDYDFPDPNSIAILTSAAFSTDGNLAGTSTDASLGGTAKAYESGTDGVVSSGKLTSGRIALRFPDVKNFEVELDAARVDPTQSGASFIVVLAGAVSPINGGASITASRSDTNISSIHEGSDGMRVQLRYGGLGGTLDGHWKMSVVGNTLTVYGPGATSPMTFMLTKATIENFGVKSGGTTGSILRQDYFHLVAQSNIALDNLVIKQVGF